MFASVRSVSIVRALYVASLLVGSACSDGGTAPSPSASVTIAPPSMTVYESDGVRFQAEVRDVMGRKVPDAAVAWSVSDTLRAELAADGYVTALKPGVVRISARYQSVVSHYDLTIAPLVVQRVLVLPEVLTLDRGDVTPIGVKVEGQGARNIAGRLVTLASDDPAVAMVDASGRVRAVGPGSTTIRATASGVTGTARVNVAGEDATLSLSKLAGFAMPRFITGDTVTVHGVKEYHEVYMEQGSLRLTGTTQPRYEIDIRYVEYDVRYVSGRLTMIPLRTQREYDRGAIQYDARGDLLMTSEYIFPLSHTASPVTGGFQVRFRVPGTDDVLDLFYRREPK